VQDWKGFRVKSVYMDTPESGYFTADEVRHIQCAYIAGLKLKGKPNPSPEMMAEALQACEAIKRAFIGLQFMLTGHYLLDHDEISIMFVPNPVRTLDLTPNPLADEIEQLLEGRDWGQDIPKFFE
jgi:hypothetical protein